MKPDSLPILLISISTALSLVNFILLNAIYSVLRENKRNSKMIEEQKQRAGR
jgi:hypothetical protein